MGFLLLPIVTVLFFWGLTTQAGQLISALPGAGITGRMENVATARAQQAEVFGAGCVDTATASPGLISAAIPVVLPSGVSTPTGAVCMTTTGPAGGRNVYAYLNGAGGVAARVAVDTGGSATWFRVNNVGQATNIATGLQSAVPSSIPAGSLLEWVQTTN